MFKIEFKGEKTMDCHWENSQDFQVEGKNAMRHLCGPFKFRRSLVIEIFPEI